MNYFTREELTASEWIATHAPAGSLLVEGDTNYPRQVREAEDFVYVPITREPSLERILANPEATLHGWLAQPKYADGFVVITRSQKLGVEMDGTLPTGALAGIEQALAESPRFTIVHRTGDATVFTLTEPRKR